MNVSCPECGSIFRVDPAKIPEGGARARCSICGGIIALSRDAAGSGGSGSQAEPMASSVPDRAPERPMAAPAPSAAGAAGAPEQDVPFSRERVAGAAVETAPEPPARAEPAFAAATTPASGRRPINPFLNNDPGMKAKRLARALVSDMITYQPQKREEGLKNNTLKQLFREEIKKSYEEYVEQVGRDVAESTAHFQDALNDILANGRKVF